MDAATTWDAQATAICPTRMRATHTSSVLNHGRGVLIAQSTGRAPTRGRATTCARFDGKAADARDRRPAELAADARWPVRGMDAHQCGNDRPGFGWIAISWEIAI